MMEENQIAFRDFCEREKANHRIVENYIYDARKNSTALHPEAREGMSAIGALDWAAVNTGVRITALKLILEALETHAPKLSEASKKVSSVVLTSAHWMVPLQGAHDGIVEAIRKEAIDRFQGQHFIGMIEPGFYPRRPVDGTSEKGLVSWHAHFLFWGEDRHQLEDAIAAFNEETPGPLYGVPPATVRRRSWRSASSCLSYMMKTPAKSYSTRRVQEHINLVTGKVTGEHDRQLPHVLRPGEHIHMRNVLRDFILDSLLLVGGNGRLLVKELRQRIERDRARYEQQRRMGRPALGVEVTGSARGRCSDEGKPTT